MPSVFSEEWRDCLRAHYSYVVRTNDQVTERTLRGVLVEAGFSDDDIRQLYLLATAHVDHVGADFVPDTTVFAAQGAPVVMAVAMPQDVIEAQLTEDALLQDESEDAELEAEAAAEEAAPPPDPDVTQLSLF